MSNDPLETGSLEEDPWTSAGDPVLSQWAAIGEGVIHSYFQITSLNGSTNAGLYSGISSDLSISTKRVKFEDDVQLPLEEIFPIDCDYVLQGHKRKQKWSSGEEKETRKH